MIGVLLLGYGAPDSVEAVEPFLTNLMGERRPTGEQLEKIKERYRMIGGKSPLFEITKRQAAALEEALNTPPPFPPPRGGGTREGITGVKFKVYIGMRYWHPLIAETIDQLLADGVTKVVALSLSPHYSRTTTGAYFKELERVVAQTTPDLQVVRAPDWYTHPLFLQALAERLKEGLEGFPEDARKDVEIVFSAHSLPKHFVASGDAYVDQVQETIEGILGLVCLSRWRLAYQSSRRGQGEDWLEPDIETVLEELVIQGKHQALLVPVSFTSDHVETLYDIDIYLRQKALDLGLDFHRTTALNDSAKFIAALDNAIRKSLAASGLSA